MIDTAALAASSNGTALSIAALQGNIGECRRILAEATAAGGGGRPDILAKALTEGYPLHQAVLGGHVDVARLLLDAGVDPHATMPAVLPTAAQMMALFDNTNMVDLWWSKCADKSSLWIDGHPAGSI
ncbi:hypothetical protein BC831DRAFT_465736 [Entophlyctis helioformis]|nr:hypothetical protein BC831DRAFT_465736 [Entophlyctis helioformis]